VILQLFQYKVWEDVSIQGISIQGNVSLKAFFIFINFELLKKIYLRIIWID
jgi:hypothetical protein